MKSTKKQPLSGRGDYLPITPIGSKNISPNVLKDAALPNPAQIKLPSGSGSGSWWAGGADAEPSHDMPAPPKKKKNGNVWSVIVDIIGGLANAGSTILQSSRSQRRPTAEPNNTALFEYLQKATSKNQSQPAKAGVINPGAIEFILLLGAGGFFISEAIKYYQSEGKEQAKKLPTKRKKI